MKSEADVILLFVLVGAGVMALAHTAPFPFLLEYIGPERRSVTPLEQRA